MSKQQHSASGYEDKAPRVLVCLPRNIPRRARLNSNFLLQITTSRFWLCRKLLQYIHRDTVLQCGLVRGVEEDPEVQRRSQLMLQRINSNVKD